MLGNVDNLEADEVYNKNGGARSCTLFDLFWLRCIRCFSPHELANGDPPIFSALLIFLMFFCQQATHLMRTTICMLPSLRMPSSGQKSLTSTSPCRCPASSAGGKLVLYIFLFIFCFSSASSCTSVDVSFLNRSFLLIFQLFSSALP